jgi:hypothetical protein
MSKLIELICDVDDFCKVFIPQWRKQLLKTVRENVKEKGK